MPASQGLPQLASSKNIARERLKIVLVHDRAEANRGLLEKLTNDLVATASRYADVDKDKVEVRIARNDGQGPGMLVVRIPLRSLKRVN